MRKFYFGIRFARGSPDSDNTLKLSFKGCSNLASFFLKKIKKSWALWIGIVKAGMAVLNEYADIHLLHVYQCKIFMSHDSTVYDHICLQLLW